MTTVQRRTVAVLATALVALVAVLGGIAVGGDGSRSGSGATVPAPTAPPASGVPGTVSDGAAPASTTAPSTTAPPTTEPEPGAHAGLVACDDPHREGTWRVDGAGVSSEVLGLRPFEGPCAGVLVDFGAAAPDVEVSRYGAVNTTTVRLHVEGPAPGPITDDRVDFDGIDDRIWTAMVTHDADGLAIVFHHPFSGTLGANVVVEDRVLAVSFRDRTADDPPAEGSYEGEPYRRVPEGPVWDGLVVDLLVDAEGSGTVVAHGYAKAPDRQMELSLYDRDTAAPVCQETFTTEGPSWLFSEFSGVCEGMGPGTYDVVVGWPARSGDPEDAVWHLSEVTVRG